MKYKDAITLVEALTGDQFSKLMILLIALALLLLPAATAFVLALSYL